MIDNIENIQHSVLRFLSDYEDAREGKLDIHERMLRSLEAPYQRMPQHDRVLGLLKEALSEEAVRAWFCFPDFDYRSQPLQIADARQNAAPEDQPGFEAAARILIDLEFLVPAPGQDGRLGYMRTYMLYLAFGAVIRNDHAPLTEAFIDWWMHVLHENARLRSIQPEHRVLPHEASLSGPGTWAPDTPVPMNMEIPDTREILPTDLADTMLRSVDRIAVMDCVCRAATEARGERACDYPIEDVCFLFNEAAREAISVGYAKELTKEQGIRLMHQLRDAGLIQVISNAMRPLSMCNCCSCCCICLNTLSRQESYLATPSRFLAETAHAEFCIGCGKCAAACQMSAISLTENGVSIDPRNCIGCGHCAVKCPAGVLRMKLRPGAPGAPSRQSLSRVYL